MANVDAMLAGAREAMTVACVFGDPVQKDGVTLVPVARVRGGGGGGGDERHNGGGGFGLVAAPAGAYVIRDGAVEWKPAVDPNRIVLGGQLVGALALFVAWRLLRRRAR